MVNRRAATVIKTSLLSMLAIAALGITRLVHSALLAHATNKTTVAQVGIMISATMMAGLFLPGGLSSAASKFIPLHLGRGNSLVAQAVYRLISFTGLLASVALSLIAAAGIYAWGASTLDAFATGLLTLAFSLYSIEKSALYGFDQVTSYVRLELTGSVLAIGSMIIVVSKGWTTYLLPLTLGYSLLILGAWVLLRRGKPRPPMSLVSTADKREIAGYVGLASLGGLASAGLLQALPIIAEAYTTQDEVTYFVTAVALVAPLYFLPRALSMALFPAMAHAHGAGDAETVRRHADVTTRALFVLLAPLFAMAVVLSRLALQIFFGSEFTDGDTVLQVLLVSTYFMVSQVGVVNALSSGDARDVRIPVGSAVVGWFAAVIAAIPLGIWLGGLGVGGAYLLAAVVSAAWPLAVIARRHQLAWYGPVIRSVLAIAIGVVIARFMSDGWLLSIVGALSAGALATAILWKDINTVLRHRE